MNKLKILRKKIDGIDTKIISLLWQREKEVKKIAAYKKSHNLSVVDKQREAGVLKRAIKKSKCKLSKIFIKDLFQRIIKYSRKLQK